MAVSVAACVSVAFGGLLDRKGRDEEPEAMSIKQEPNGNMAGRMRRIWVGHITGNKRRIGSRILGHGHGRECEREDAGMACVRAWMYWQVWTRVRAQVAVVQTRVCGGVGAS
jgi:hypothetical protein